MRLDRALVVLAMSLSFAAAAMAQDRLVAVLDPSNGRYLYLDSQGKIAIPGPFEAAESFSGGLGRVQASPESTAYLNQQGKVAFTWPSDFASTSAFHDGLAAFARDGRVGFLNPRGQEAISAQFVATGRDLPAFSANRAVVLAPTTYGWLLPDGKVVPSTVLPLEFSQGYSFLPTPYGYRLIDQNGQTLGQDTYSEVGTFSEGLAPVFWEGRAGWIDASGAVVLVSEGDRVGPFVGGFGVVYRNGWAGLIDRKGVEAVPNDRYLELVALHSATDAFKVWKFQEKAGGPWGLVTEKGAVLAPAQWDEVGRYQEGLAVVRSAKRSGLVNAKGALAAPLIDGEYLGVAEAMVGFRVGGKVGYADVRGKVLLEAQWLEGGAFAGGLAAVRGPEGWGLIDKKGKAVGPRGYSALSDLVGKRRAFRMADKSGFLDEKGAVVEGSAPPEVPKGWFVSGQVDPFSPLLLTRPGRFGLIDKTGAFVLPPAYAAIWPGEGGPHAVQTPEGEFFYASEQGAKLFSPPEGWQPAGPFRQAIAAVVRVSEGRAQEYALISATGQSVSAGFLAVKGSYSGGAFCVQFSSGKWGYVGPTGTRLFALEWDDAQPFSEGLAAVAFDGQWGYIDSTGKKIIPYQYTAAGAFQNGLAPVTVYDTPSYITLTGQRVWP